MSKILSVSRKLKLYTYLGKVTPERTGCQNHLLFYSTPGINKIFLLPGAVFQNKADEVFKSISTHNIISIVKYGTHPHILTQK